MDVAEGGQGEEGSSEREHELAELARSIQSGADTEASFRRLHQLLWPAVRRFFVRKGISAEESLDLTQEVFLGIYRGLEGFRHESRLETWVYRIATTTYLKRIRSATSGKRSGQEVPYEETHESPPPTALEADQLDEVIGREKAAAIREALDELPDQMKSCLTLRLDQELSYREIAVVMKLKIDTVKAHLFQARKRLRQRLGDEECWELDG